MTAFVVPATHFQVPVDVVVLGLVTGLTYGLLGMGLTLVYRSSRVLNFAHGELGALPAVLVPVLVINHGVSYWLAVPLALAVAGGLGALTELTVIRRLANAPRLIVLVATIGVSQVLLVIEALIPRQGKLAHSTFPVPFHFGFTVGSYFVSPGQVVIIVVAPLVTAALSLFLRRTRLGMGSRAAAENREAAQLAGVPVRRVSLTIWIVAGLLSGVSAILAGPTRPLLTQQAIGPDLMVRALAAAMIGGLTSLPRVFVGGAVIGLVEALVSFNYPTGGALELVLFVLIVASLALRRGLGQLARGGEGSSWSLAGAIRSLPPRVAVHPAVVRARRAFLAAALLIAALAPLAFGPPTHVLMTSVVLYALIGLSLVVLTGFAGQVSLGQFAFVGLGALLGGRLLQLGFPAWTAVLYSVTAGGAAAFLVGIPALRIRGLFLAVTTLAFSLAADNWLFGQSWLVVITGDRSSLTIPRPILFGIHMERTRNYYWMCLAVLCVVGAAVHRLRRTGIGRTMLAVRDNEPAAASLAAPPRRTKLTAFVLAGMIASLGGYLYGGLLVNIGGASGFGPLQSLDVLVMTIFGGITTVTGAVLGALWVRGIPYFLGDNVGLISSGIGLLVVLLALPGGLASLAFRVRDRVVRGLIGGPIDAISPAKPPGRAVGLAGAAPVPREHAGDPDAPPLEAVDIVVAYGGVRAVDHASLVLRPGEVVGLVGSNGAGKTTLFDVLSGHIVPAAGRVTLHGADIAGLRPEERALLGLARTFQQARLFDDLTVIDCFALALERSEPSELIPSLLGLPPSRAAEARKQMRAGEIVELVGLQPFAHRAVAELSTGTRRMVEIGCAVALGADVLLLDEPSAGIAQREVEAFVPALEDIRRHLGASVLLVDHDIPMIGAVADRVYVMATGSVIAEGPPSILHSDERVVAAYLGTDERVIHRSGTPAVSAGNGSGRRKGPAPSRPRAAAGKRR